MRRTPVRRRRADAAAHRGRTPTFAVPLPLYARLARRPARGARADLADAWGDPADDPAVRDGRVPLPRRAGRAGARRAPARPGPRRRPQGALPRPRLPPTHAYLAFHLGLRAQERSDALIHLGTHGTTEWLPGKAVALSDACWPRLAVGATPVCIPFIVDDPGEAAPAKRRIGGSRSAT